jgi:hypothetical protein
MRCPGTTLVVLAVWCQDNKLTLISKAKELIMDYMKGGPSTPPSTWL